MAFEPVSWGSSSGARHEYYASGSLATSPSLVLTRVCCLSHDSMCCVASRSSVYTVIYCAFSLCTFRSLPRGTHLSANRWSIFATTMECKTDVDRCLLGSGLTSASCPCRHFRQVPRRGRSSSGFRVCKFLVLWF